MRPWGTAPSRRSAAANRPVRRTAVGQRIACDDRITFKSPPPDYACNFHVCNQLQSRDGLQTGQYWFCTPVTPVRFRLSAYLYLIRK